MGWAAVHVDPSHIEGGDSNVGRTRRLGGHGECLRRSRGKAAAEQLGADPVNRCMVNMGTVPGSPSPAHRQRAGGQARQRATHRYSVPSVCCLGTLPLCQPGPGRPS
jgi:hypothetical protein